mmetsp:Transcript_92819/g.289398  ORF Transcript_92819/g.289398 Transcript_92819/m.289398 type:complete len:108 (-) Transcript_92819:1056-1379(-)
MGPNWKVLTLCDRYKISRTSVLGEGASAVVYKGLDVRECRNVAVKLYNYDAAQTSAARQNFILQDFRKCIMVFSSLGASDDVNRLAVRRTSTSRSTLTRSTTTLRPR